MKNGLREPSNDAILLNSVREMDFYYINKPRKFIIFTLFRFYGWFFLCALLSFHILMGPMVPVWTYCIYKFYIGLKYLKKYNVSKCKIAMYTVFIIAIELISSAYIRDAIWVILIRIF